MTPVVRGSKIHETLLDRVIQTLAPSWGLQRRAARLQLSQSGGYVGGRRDRRQMQDYHRPELSADAALIPDLPALRDTSNEMMRNQPIARGAVNTACTNVVGAGLLLTAQVNREYLGLSDEEADAWEMQAEMLWYLWAGSQECDLGRTLRFNQIMDIAFRSMLVDGDHFLLEHFLERPGSPFGLKLQLVDGARVSNPNRARDTDTLVAGVERDGKTGAPLAYWISDRHPGNRQFGAAALKWTRHPAFGARSGRRRVHHLFRPERADQTRGIPWLAAAIEPLKMLSSMTEAELMAAVINACLAVTTTTNGDSSNRAPLHTAAAPNNPGSVGLKKVGIDFQPGMVIEGFQPGEGVDSFGADRPNPAFDPFLQAILRQVGVSLEIPFEVLIKHFTASYSAARAALLELWKFVTKMRGFLIEAAAQPTYESFLIECVARELLEAPGFFTDPLAFQAWTGSIWTGPPPGQIDGEKEANAAEINTRNGWKTDAQVTAELNGGDWHRNVRQRRRELALRRRAGMDAEPVAERIATETTAIDDTSKGKRADDKGAADESDQEDAA